MRTRKLLRIGLVQAVLIAGLVAPTAAKAYPIVCDPSTSWATFASTTAKVKIKQHYLKENYTGAKHTYSITLQAGTTETNTVGVSGGASVKGSAWIFAEYEAHIGIEMGTSTSKTYFASYTSSWSLPSGDTYVIYNFAKSYNTTWSEYRCSSNGATVTKVANGTVYGVKAQGDGAVGCKQSPPSGTGAYEAKRLYCG